MARNIPVTLINPEHIADRQAELPYADFYSGCNLAGGVGAAIGIATGVVDPLKSFVPYEQDEVIKAWYIGIDAANPNNNCRLVQSDIDSTVIGVFAEEETPPDSPFLNKPTVINRTGFTLQVGDYAFAERLP